MTICQVVLLVLCNIKTMNVVPADQHLAVVAKLVLNLVVNVTECGRIQTQVKSDTLSYLDRTEK